MKKLIVGIAASAMVLTGSVAYGATSSIIGAKVQGLFSVVVNGEKISDAVVINGLTYVPIRSLTDSIGGDIKVVGKTVSVVTPTQSPDVGLDERSIILKGKIYGFETEITKRERKITMLQTEISEVEKIIAGNDASPLYKDFGMVYREGQDYKNSAAKIVELQVQVDAVKAEITDLQAQIAAVETELAQ